MAKVLVAEDDTLTRHFLKQALQLGGHDITAVADGNEAIAAIDAGDFDAVITDYSMPGATGVDVIAHAHRADPLVACIVVTAFRDLDLAMQAMHAGAVAFIPKPCKTEHLNTMLNSALERRELAAEAVRLQALAPLLERFTLVLANTIESRDAITQRHANRMVQASEVIARHMGVADRDLMSVRFGACLHDIGKIAVPDSVLRKPGPLSEREKEIVRLHPEVGALMLEGIDTWENVRQVIRHHHERFDGAGYPDGLRGEEIPLGARIVAIVDAADVMMSGRPYSEPKPYDQMLHELAREAGKQFDPQVVEAFLTVAADERLALQDFQLPQHPLIGQGLGGESGISISGWLSKDFEPLLNRVAV